MYERDWMLLIDKTAALKEQFPSLAKVRKERPGTEHDRALRELYHADNRRSLARTRRTWDERVKDQHDDAERFIAKQRERQLAEYAAKWHAKHGRTA